MIIFDASTLILLAKIELLKEISKEVEIIIAVEVKNEATRKKDLFDVQIIRELIEQDIIRIEEVKDRKSIEKLKKDFNIAEGEAASLVLAKGKGFILATDDGPAIKAAKILGVHFTTAIDFLIRAYEREILTKKIAMSKLDRLSKYGRYTSRIIEDAIERLGVKEG